MQTGVRFPPPPFNYLILLLNLISILKKRRSRSGVRGMKNSFTDIYIEDFKKLAALGAVQEFKSRMLANKHDLKFTNKKGKVELAASAFSSSDTEEAVFDFFDKEINSEEKIFLSSTRQIRNKLLHCEFGEFVSLLEKLIEAPLPQTALRKITLGDGAEGILKSLKGALANFRNLPTVDEENDTDIFGRFLSCASRGGLKAAIAPFERSISILDRLLEQR